MWGPDGRCWPFAALLMEISCASDPVCPLALPWARPGSLPSRSCCRALALTEPPPLSLPPRPPPARLSPIPLTRPPALTFMSTIKRSQHQCLFRQRPWHRERAVLHDRGGRERRPTGPDGGRGRAGALHRHHDLRLGNRAGPNHLSTRSGRDRERRLDTAGASRSPARTTSCSTGSAQIASSEPSTSPAARPTSPSTADLPPTKAPDRGNRRGRHNQRRHGQPDVRPGAEPDRGGSRARPGWSSPATPSRLTLRTAGACS